VAASRSISSDVTFGKRSLMVLILLPLEKYKYKEKR